MEREGQINNIPDNCKVTIHNNDYIVFNGKQYQITSETTGIFSRKTYPVVTINGIKYVVGPLAKRYPNAILLYDNNQILFIGDTRNILNKLYKIFNSNHGITFNENGQKKYEGGFKNGKYHGKGTEFFLNGQKEYEGGFKNGMYHGKGVWFYSDGEKGYEGEFENGKYHGKGTLFDEHGKLLYEGGFENGKYHGKGTLFDEHGKLLYEGEFENGEYHGEGTEFFLNGRERYKGGFENGKYHGKGTEFFTNGQKEYEGEFENGKYHGEGVWFYSDGGLRWYEGGFENGKYHGKGTLFYLDGRERYKGGFENGKYHGEGIVFFPNGQKEYEGGFENGEYHGKGTEFFLNGRERYKGGFENGEYHGEGGLFDEHGKLLYEGGFLFGKQKDVFTDEIINKIKPIETELQNPEQATQTLSEIVSKKQEYLIPLLSEKALDVIEKAANSATKLEEKQIAKYIEQFKEDEKDEDCKWLKKDSILIENNQILIGDGMNNNPLGNIKFLQSIFNYCQFDIKFNQERLERYIIMIENPSDLNQNQIKHINAFINALNDVKKELEKRKQKELEEKLLPQQTISNEGGINKMPKLSTISTTKSALQNLNTTNKHNGLGGLNQP